jgi:hypothetical protein
MRFLNEKNNEALERITVYLTHSEASELKDSLSALLETKSHHEHIPSEDYQKELTICIYNAECLDQFDERSRRLIESDI